MKYALNFICNIESTNYILSNVVFYKNNVYVKHYTVYSIQYTVKSNDRMKGNFS